MNDIVFVPIGYLTKTIAWKKWLHYVVKKLQLWEVYDAAIVCKNGKTIAASQQFYINLNEFKEIIGCFVYDDTEMISLMGVTYCVKSITDSQLIAFNGNHYLIVSQTESMFIFFKCTSRFKSILVADWLKKTAQKIQERHY